MKTNISSAVKMLVVALLMLGACFGAASERSDCARHQRPKISINGLQDKSGKYLKSYGDNVTLYCSSHTTLIIEENGVPQRINELNTTTVQLYKAKPNIGVYKYTCSDNDCDDYVFVSIRPVMSVKSQKVYHKLDLEYNLLKYFVPLGADYEVFCSGGNDKPLRILLNNYERLQTQVVNGTIVKYTTKADTNEDKSYFCRSKVVTSSEEDVHEMISVTADYMPLGLKFWCKITIWNILTCLWKYSSELNIRYTLFYTDHDSGERGIEILCTEHFGKQSNECKVNADLMGRQIFCKNHNVSFILMTCNEFLCNNQTFTMNTNAIIQLKPVRAKRVKISSARSVVVPWENDCEYECVYGIKYRMSKSEDNWQQVYTSSVRCDKDCQFELLLPFPNTSYEVMVYVKNKEASDELMWSDPAWYSVTTMPRTPCACNDPELCKACALTDDIIREKLALAKKVRKLSEKLGKIRYLSTLLSLSRKINERINDIS